MKNIYVVELIDGKKNEFKMEINNLKNQFLEGKYLDIVPKHMDYTEVHESNHAYFKYFTRVLSPTRVITLTISEGFFELNLESFSRTTSEIDKQAFEVKADLFLGQFKNANTLQSGIIDTLKSIADESFGDLISEVDKEDMTDIFAEQQERGYNTSDNTFRVTVTNIIQEVLTLSEFVDNTLNFVESGMSLAEHATLITAYNNLNNYYNSFIIAE